MFFWFSGASKLFSATIDISEVPCHDPNLDVEDDAIYKLDTNNLGNPTRHECHLDNFFMILEIVLGH